MLFTVTEKKAFGHQAQLWNIYLFCEIYTNNKKNYVDLFVCVCPAFKRWENLIQLVEPASQT